MSDPAVPGTETHRGWWDVLTPQSMMHSPVGRQRGRAITTVWLVLVLLGTPVGLQVVANASGRALEVSIVVAACTLCTVLAPVVLRVAASWRVASVLLVSAALALTGARAMTAQGPAPDVLAYVVLLPLTAYLAGALTFGVLTALACTAIVYSVIGDVGILGGGPSRALLAPWIGLIVAVVLRRLLFSSYEETARLNQRLTSQTRDLDTSRDRAAEAERAKADFLANMSHEIRTPLNGVIGMSSLLMDTPLNSQQRDYAETIRASSEALLTVINDVLDFSKVEAGQLTIVEETVDLVRLVDQVAQLFAQQAAAASVELVTDIAPDVPQAVIGDEGRLRQILVNLVGNAVKFTPSGEIVLRLSVDETRDNSIILGFEIEDTGTGIPIESQGRLFEKFFQADASSTRAHGGTGLGLAICARLVDMMGGQIGVDSTHGLGSTFWFTAPVKRLFGKAPDNPFALSQGLRVLVVDDNDTQRDVMTARIASWGAHPIPAASATAALDELASESAGREPIELAIIDLHMPRMNGIELSQAIQATQRDRPLPVLLMTSIGFNVERSAYQNAGIRHTIAKPIRWTQLFELMAEVPRRAPIVEQFPSIVPPAEQRSRHVLIVEDNAVNQKVARHMLESLGYSADVVSNGVQAIEACRRTPYAAVLMDVHMPVMDGIAATREVRQLEADSGMHTPIIAMTADALPADRKRCLDAGMDAHLPKPMQMETLEPLLRYWTAVGRQRQQTGVGD